MVLFLPKSVVLDIQQEQVKNSPFDDVEGILNPDSLDSALNQPRMTISTTGGRAFLHPTIFDMAAAYGFHLCQNHAFVSCNKRTAYSTMVTFLRLNGFDIIVNNDEVHRDVMVAVDEVDVKKIQTSWPSRKPQRQVPPHVLSPPISMRCQLISKQAASIMSTPVRASWYGCQI